MMLELPKILKTIDFLSFLMFRNVSVICAFSFEVSFQIRCLVGIDYFLSLVEVLSRQRYKVPIWETNEMSIEYQCDVTKKKEVLI